MASIKEDRDETSVELDTHLILLLHCHFKLYHLCQNILDIFVKQLIELVDLNFRVGSLFLELQTDRKALRGYEFLKARSE